MLAVAYDGLLRAGEVTAIVVEDFDFADDGSATLKLWRSKTDPDGRGTVLFIAADTAALVRSWLVCGDIAAGPAFRGLRQAPRLSDEHVTFAYRELALLAGYPAEIVDQITSHSPRVGAAQDMVAAGIDLAAIMQAARWRTTGAFSRYTQRLAPRRGAPAHLAQQQRPLGRDRILRLVSEGGAAREDARTECRTATAFHLAGRTFAARALGIAMSKPLYIHSEAHKQLSGLRQPLLPGDHHGGPAARAIVEDVAIIHSAGVAALSRHWREHNRRLHTQIELTQARELFRCLSGDEAEIELRLNLARHRGASIIGATGAMAAIGRLAAALLDGQRVTPARSFEILDEGE